MKTKGPNRYQVLVNAMYVIHQNTTDDVAKAAALRALLDTKEILEVTPR